MIAKHIHVNDLVGKKIRIIVEDHQFECGLSANIFQSYERGENVSTPTK